MLTRQTPGEIFNKKKQKKQLLGGEGGGGGGGGALYSVYLQGMTLILNSSSRCTGQRERGSEAQTMENMSGFLWGRGRGSEVGGDQ